ncbi:MAG: TolC family protein, partial [Verrucomicrobia bacterium]|nr:TolC family protein [Verrucomicrobiota bacterium]
MRLTLFALTFAGMSCNVIAGGESTLGFRNHPLTIDEAVQLALKQNPSILQQVQQLKVQKGLFYQAQARLLPQLTANSSYSQNDSALSAASSAGASK